MIYVTFHRPVLPSHNQTNAGGGSTVIDDLRHADLNIRQNLSIISTDPHDGEVDKIAVKAINPEKKWLESLRTEYLFANTWLALFNHSYTSPALSSDYLSYMYGNEQPNFSPIGSIQRLREFIAQHSPSSQVEAEFVNRYDSVLKNLPENSTLRWNDFCFAPHIVKYADVMRKRNIEQSWHIHTSIPAEHLADFDWGVKFIRATSLLDTVYVHTNQLKARLENYLEKLGLRVPKILRFDLGTSGEKISKILNSINADNYKSKIPNYETLSDNQKTFIADVLVKDNTIPHRFMSVCRFDPVKGLDTIIAAIENFLLQEERDGKPIDDLYRFYFISNLFFDINVDYQADNLSQGYAIYATKRFSELQIKYPRIVKRCDSFTGEQRVILPVLMKDCHGMTGGREDGLNLALQEFAWANQDKPTTLIAGNGAGLVQHIIDSGFSESGYYFEPNQPQSFVNAFRAISKSTAQYIFDKKNGLFEKLIKTRMDSIVFPTSHD